MYDIDWEYWGFIEYELTWKVSLLSIGINPEKAQLIATPSGPKIYFDDKYHEFLTNREIPKMLAIDDKVNKRLTILERAKNSNKFAMNSDCVNIKKFIKWANKNKLEIPSDLQNLEDIDPEDKNFSLETRSSKESLKFKKKYSTDDRNLLIKEITLKTKNKDSAQDQTSFIIEGYLLALKDLGVDIQPIKAGTIVRDIYTPDQWWVREVKQSK